jgi:cytochrome c2
MRRKLIVPYRHLLPGGLAALLVVLSACDRATEREAAALTGGDPVRGQAALRQYGCSSCHVIPGVPGAQGLVGPPLGGVASRVYLAGALPNTPENMIRWIQTPQEVDPHTAMPDLGVPEPGARDMASYLYSLR